MSKKSTVFAVLTRHRDVSPFIQNVIEAADRNKNALGFFAASVFQEFARSEELYVIVNGVGEQSEYAGHLLFNCRFPKASVLQISVEPQFRGHGAAKTLLDHLKSALTQHGFISIYARVAEDLVGANVFWEREGFYVQRVAPGGNARKRTILVRSHELASSQLFASSGFSSENPLGLDVSESTETPLFLLDLNVLFDLGPRRMRHEDAIDLFRAERLGTCCFAVSEELGRELKRTATEGRTDPMQNYVEIFPTFPYLEGDEWESLFSSLAVLVFPEKLLGNLGENDKSDLRHLITAIQHRLAGLITNDAAILSASARIKDLYGIQVVSPTAFKQAISEAPTESAFETPSTDTLTLTQISDSDGPTVHALLASLGISGSAVAAEWAVSESGRRVSSRYGVWSGSQLLGYVVWPSWSPNDVILAHVAVDESSTQSESAARALLMFLLETAAGSGSIQIRIEFPCHQVHIREVAAGLGFSGTANEAVLSKLVLGRIVTSATWDQCRSALASIGRLKLPDRPPVFRNVDQQIDVLTPDGNRAHVSLHSLETLLGPALFCLPGRGAVITPVKREFSEHLLGHLPQKSLLPQFRVALLRERHYLSDPRTLKHFKRGNLILFYESLKQGGLGSIVSIARTQRAYLKLQGDLESADFAPSVLDTASLEAIGRAPIKTVTVFDSVMHFRKPIPMETLKRIGCGRPTDLLTTHPISDHQLQVILSEGTACD